MRIMTSLVLALVLVLSGCSSATGEMSSNEEKGVYVRISAEEAKQIIDSGEEVIILDVRTEEEFNSGHIKDAMLLPYDLIETQADGSLPDKDAKILVYCRSGNRSAVGAVTLLELGYTDVIDFGGIIDWPYEIVTE